MQRLRIAQLFITLSVFLVMAMAHAGNPVWTFAPVAGFPPTVTVDKMGSATVKYTVTNQSSRKHTLVMLPQRGISQVQPCQLAPKGTCTLTLIVNGSLVPPSGISGGPALCQAKSNGSPNPNQCYRPSQGNELNIKTATIPGAPTQVTAVAGVASASVSWVAPSDNGGSPIISYTVVSNPQGYTCKTSGLTCTVQGLTNGTTYTFRVSATNVIGTGPLSSPSNPVTPGIYTITPSAGANGTISPNSPQTVIYGDNITFLATPSTGYTVSGWTVDGAPYTACHRSTTCQLTNVSADHTIAVNFTKKILIVRPRGGAHGSISPNTLQPVAYGGDITFTGIPDTGYIVKGWRVDGVPYPACGASPTCQLKNVTTSHLIAVSFVKQRFTITPSAGTNGTISPDTKQIVAYGGNSPIFTATPSTGYVVSGWTLDGAPYAACSTKTTCQITNVTANHAIAVSFAQETFSITPSSGANGTISPNTIQTVVYGDDIAFTATPDAGYIVAGWSLDGAAYAACGTDTTCQLANVQANHTIAVSFTQQTFSISPSAGANGTISPDTEQIVTYGANSPIFTAAPSTGYVVSGWTLDGAPYTACGTDTMCQLTNVTADHAIAVSFAQETFSITPSSGANGNISPNTTQTVAYGNNITFTASPNTGYAVGGWTVDGTSYAACGTNTTCQLTDVQANHTIAVSFVQQTFSITPSSGANGSINPDTIQTVAYGNDISFTAAPSTGYEVSSWTVDGSPYDTCGTNTTCELSNVTADHTIAVSFTQKTFFILPRGGANGAISPSTLQTVVYGADSTTFTAIPNTGYVVSGWRVDGVPYDVCGTNTTCQLTNVTANHIITVRFTQETFTITPSAGTNGTISPSDPTSVNYGDNISFTATPSTGYVVSGWTLDGAPYAACGTGTSCQLTNVTADHTIAVSFTQQTFSIAPSSGANGSISPDTVQTVTYDSDSPIFTATPDTGYDVEGWTVDGVSYGACGTNTTCQLTNVQANHTIAVSFVQQTFSISPNAGANGSIDPNTIQTVAYGNDISFTAIPNTGYKVSGWLVDNVAYAECGTNTTCQLADVTADHTIEVSFTQETFFILPRGGANGTISPSTLQTVVYGADSTTFTAAPNTGYVVSGWRVDGVPYDVCGTNTTCQLTNVTANHIITVRFTQETFTITPSAGANGTISPSDPTTVVYGSNITFTATPNTGYAVSGWTLDGVPYAACGTNASCQLSNVQSDQSIAVSFIQTFTVSPSAGANGTISPGTDQTVIAGDDITFTATPDASYNVAGWTVDGVAYAPCATNTTCQLTNVTADHEIAVSFNQTFIITPSAGANGTISPNTPQAVTAGADSPTFTASPDAGFTVTGWTVDGTAYPACGTDTSCQLNNVQANHTIAVSFVETFTITPSAGANGSISPNTVQTVNSGDSITFTATPDTGSIISGWTVDGSAYPTCGTSTTCELSNISANHTIAVSFIQTFTITPSAGENGSISPDTVQTVNSGDNISFTATPNTGYEVSGWLVDNVAYPTCGANTTCQLTDISSNHTITVNFAQQALTVTSSAGANGSITPAGATQVPYGENVSFTATPSTGYVVSNWMVDGVSYDSCGADQVCDLTNVTTAHTIVVNFVQQTFNVTPSAGTNGAIDPDSVQTIAYGGSVTFTASPNVGYEVSEWQVNGARYDGCGTSTACELTNITSNQTITVNFASQTFTVTSNAGANGSITPNGTTTVVYGENASFTATPSTGYEVSEWLVNGATYSACGTSTTCELTNITSNQTITVNFASQTFTVSSNAGANGSITPDGITQVVYGESASFTATPNTGYEVSEWQVNGARYDGCGTSTTCELTNITSNQTITVNFALQTFTVTSSAGANGSITPDGTTQVAYGANLSFTATPSTGYVVSNWMVDGVSYDSCGADQVCELTNVTTAHTIVVNFVQQTFSVTPSAGTNGAIDPDSVQTIAYGGSVTFTASPNVGYEVSEWQVNGARYDGCGSSTACELTNITSNQTITVNFASQTFTVTSNAGANGSITPNGTTTVVYGENASFTATPSTGYEVSEWLVNGATYSACGTSTTCELTNITSNQTITVNFASQTFTVSSNAGANGSITPDGITQVVYGESASFTATPNTGYEVSEWQVNGARYDGCGTSTTCELTNITSNQTITVNFALQTFTVTSNAGANGSISPDGTTPVVYGENASFTATPNTGYEVSEWQVNGARYDVCGTYTTCELTNITSNQTITVNFALQTFTVTPQAGENGSIMPSSPVQVSYDGNYTFTASPNQGYEVSEWQVNGARYDACGTSTTCQLTNITSDQTITVNFVSQTFTVTSNAGANGTITPDGTTQVLYGEDATFTAAATTTGYVVSEWLVNGVRYDACGTDTVCVLTNVTSNQTITVNFVLEQFTIIPISGGNGAIYPNTPEQVAYGANSSVYSANPDTGYTVSGWVLDSSTAVCGTNSTCQLTNVTANHTLTVNFIQTFTVTSSAGANGSIDPAGETQVSSGGNITFTATPSSGYVVNKWQVNGSDYAACGKDTTCQLTNVTSNQTIFVSFIQSTTISVKGSPLLLTPNTTGYLTVTNNGSVTAIDVQATLPPDLAADVTQNASNCVSLASKSSCYLQFTSNAQVHSATTITIAGTNTNSVNATLSVAVPYVANDIVYATVLDKVNNIIYIGGDFTQVGPNTGFGVPVDIHKGLFETVYPSVNGPVLSVVSDGFGGWYIGGNFSQVGGVERDNLAHILHDGSLDLSWEPKVNGAVHVLKLSNNTLFAGGRFTSINGQERFHIAALDAYTGYPTSWSPNVDGTVYALAVTEGSVYLGGDFTSINGQPRKNIATVDVDTAKLRSWSPNADRKVTSLLLGDHGVYVGGDFTVIGKQNRNHLAEIDAYSGLATSWNPNANKPVKSLIFGANMIYAGGEFTSIGGQNRNHIAAIDIRSGLANSWNPNADESVNSLLLGDNMIYAGGDFTAIGGQNRNHIAALDINTGTANSWKLNADRSVDTLAMSGSTVYLGGKFSSLAAVTRNHAAAISADSGEVTSWNPNLNGTVKTLFLSGNQVYIGGEFNVVGTSPNQSVIYYITRVSTSDAVADPFWHPNPDGAVNSVVVGANAVYIGGLFSKITLNNATRNGIAALDIGGNGGAQQNWNANLSGAQIYSIVVSDQVYFGGFYFTPSLQQKFIGAASLTTGALNSTWSVNANDIVRSLALNGSTMYLGGDFTTISGADANNNTIQYDRNYIAAVSTSGKGIVTAWNPDADDAVYALALSDNTLYAAGAFSNIGSKSRSGIAALNADTNSTGSATSWTANLLLPGIGYAIALSDSTVYIGGDFNSVGGSQSSNFAIVPMRLPSP
ncbi:fibronectin type III domain-containing protein [Legionella longbeachae]|uniref:Putative transmembrane protein (Fibronectin III domain and Gp5 C-terminal repeat) n=3 Tax=Legionella longbeachae TaxID=450 RepID=D3HLW9_LEGLN|nr:fibronectin type III domain-containing protein [Legionella longbeachae]VEE03878.1 transmembrane protein (fibronectin III domain and Gp5 C-terminal repeat) [Legionella oakridgensis]ARB93264.1 fibronectin type III domain-containing protein [Legionella longbeachae]QIN33543.1 hypothetical protein GCB94_16005 [Legionella longbeachae]RZV21634.1 fibronectin type III domain-containing protein [Legionella longbeachae]CBJ13449.1 putative transmembrane protein (fibronectin III domain and Gp5 C-termina